MRSVHGRCNEPAVVVAAGQSDDRSMHQHDTEQDERRTPTDQWAAWNGAEGERWVRYSKERVRGGDLVEPLVRGARIGGADRVLDIGCGTGGLTLAAARVAERGAAVGVDLSALMITEARATAAAAGLRNVTFEVGDVQTHAFAAGSFDLAVSHFGVMFFADPVAAFANVASALRAGGRLVFAGPGPMEDCDWYGVPLEALLGRPPTPELAPSVMFSLSDPDVIHGVLGGAGFEDVRVAELPGEFWFGPDPDAAAETLLGTGPARAHLERNPEVSEDRARALVSRAIAPWQGADGVRLPGRHWLVEARTPGGRR